jgi:SAM-dependent methyltransferase
MSLISAHYAATDVRYIAAFDPIVAPARLQLAVTLAGAAWAPRDRERLSVLDIGCGRGLTPMILAAANPGWDVTGLDLQPAHIAEAREIAADAGLDNARFIEADVAGLDAERAARLVPEADIVLCHGVWTWVPDVVREGIVELLRARVKPGGIVLMGYNALPAQAPYIALQRLLQDSVRGVPGTPAERGAHALGVLARIRAIGSPHLPPPAELDRIVARAEASPDYMAHQWFTDFWRPVFQADLARDLARAQLDYAGPVRPAAAMAELQLRPPQQAGLAALPAWMDPQTRLDAFLDRRFRFDIFVRGRRPAPRNALGEITLALGGDPARATVRLPTQAGSASLSPAQQAALLGALSGGPKRLAELAALPGADGLSAYDIAVMLTETFIAHPLWRDAAPDPAMAARAARCNLTVLHHYGIEAEASGTPLGAVALGLGSGVPASAVDLGTIAALQAGLPAEAGALARQLAPPGADAKAQDALAAHIAGRLATHLDAWRALGVL